MTDGTDGAGRGALRDREPIVLVDRKARTYLRTLRAGRTVSVRGAGIPCDRATNWSVAGHAMFALR